MPLLDITNCTIAFGGLIALESVSLKVDGGELVGLIGPNGAGKTTVFNMITGVYKPVVRKSTETQQVDIRFDGESIRGLPPYAITKKGIARTFQNIRLFPALTALDNIRAAFHVHSKTSLFSTLMRSGSYNTEEHEITKQAIHLLHVFELGHYQNELAGSLPYGEQRRLEMARALATKPKLLLLDEPAAGMNPHETRELMETIKQLRDNFQVTILLIEHDMKVVMGICERIYVLDYGEMIAHGTPSVIQKDPKVIQAYLGE